MSHLRLVWSNLQHKGDASWRPYAHEPWWQSADVVVAHEGRGSGGRVSYEVYVRGDLVAIRPSFEEAKTYVEDRFGSLSFGRVPLPPVKVDHPHWGPTTEFSAPTFIWVATLPVAAV